MQYRTPAGPTAPAVGRRPFLAGAAALALAAAVRPARADAVRVAVPSNEPVVFVDGGVPQGPVGVVARAAFERIGWQPVWEQGIPYPRLYEGVHEGVYAAGLATFGTPARRALAHYSIPIVTEYSVLAVRRGEAFPFAAAADLAGKTLGTRIGLSYPAIDAVAAITKEAVADDEGNVRKLLAGRLDAAVIGSVGSLFKLRGAGLADGIEILPTAIARIGLGVAVDDGRYGQDVVDRIDATIREMTTGADWPSVLDRFGGRDLFRDYGLVPEA